MTDFDRSPRETSRHPGLAPETRNAEGGQVAAAAEPEPLLEILARVIVQR